MILYWTEVAGGPIYRCDGTTLTSYAEPTPTVGTLVLGPDRILVARAGSSGGSEINFDLTTLTDRPTLTWSGVELKRDHEVAIGVYDAVENAYWLHLYPAHPSQGVITGQYPYWAKVSPAGDVLSVHANDWAGTFWQAADNPAEGNAVLAGAYLYWNSDGRGQLFRLNTTTGATEWLSLMEWGAGGVEQDKFWAAPIGAMSDGRLVMMRRETIADAVERHYVGIYDLAAAGWVSSGSAGGYLPTPDVEWPMQGTAANNVTPGWVARPGGNSGIAAHSGDFVYFFGWELTVTGPGDHYSIWAVSLTDGSFTQFANLDATDGLGYTGTDIVGMIAYGPIYVIDGIPLDSRRRFWRA